MNVKLITKALHTLSLLSEEDYDLVLKFRALNEDEKGMLMLALEPSKPAGKKASKSTPRKIQHCAVCNWTKRAALHKDTTRDDYHEFVLSQPEPSKPNGKPVSKSPRATRIERQLNKRREQGRAGAIRDDNEDDGRCTYKLGEDAGGPIICNALIDNNVHHKQTDPDFHPFQFGASTATTRSPANGGAGSSTQNSEASAASAGAATGGSSE